jgi:hypothetical protein
MRFFGVPPLRRILLLLLIGGGLIAWKWHAGPRRWRLNPRVTDEIGLLGKELRIRHEEQLQSLFEESGVDLRLLLVPTTGGEPIEQYATRRARELGVGRKTGGRGLLIVYDSARHAMRIEVGPRLQGILPDGFIGFVMREHARTLFEGGDPELGIRLTVRILHWRIREALLDEEYDPSFQEYVKDVRRLAIGGGASADVGPASRRPVFTSQRAGSADSSRFAPQPTVRAAYSRFLEWLALDRYVSNVPLFTPETQTYLADLPLTRAYSSGWLAMEYGRAYAIDERGDVAMLYFTGTPLASPHFFRRTPSGWQLDFNGELANTLEAVGGWYSWILLDSGDQYSRTFADRYLPYDDAGFGFYYRVAGGDNRRLARRGTGDAVESELDPRPRRQPPSDSSDAGRVEHLTVFQAAQRIEAVTNRPSVVVLYAVDGSDTRDSFGGLVTLAEFCANHGIELLAFDISDDAQIAELPEFLASKGARFPAVHVYRWRSGLLGSSFGRVGIRIPIEWMPPLVAVRDRSGRVVWQEPGIRDWATVLAEARSAVE